MIRISCFTVRATTVEPGPVDEQLIGAHLRGAKGFLAAGYLPGDDTGTTTGMADLDTKDYPEPGSLDDARLRLVDVAQEAGVLLYLEESTRGGTHAHLFTDEPVPHTVMHRALSKDAQRAVLVKTEVYPAGDDHTSTWYIMPYAGAQTDPKRLGRTFLSTVDGEPIPFDELDEWIERTPAAAVLALAESHVEPESVKAEATEPADLAPEAIEPLKQLSLTPPTSFDRHGSLIAFINLSRRCGHEGEMLDHLKSKAVRTAWVSDGSRDAREWAAEVDRWAKAPRGTKERGINYLRAQGFGVPRLPKIEDDEVVLQDDEVIVNRQVKEVVRDLVRGLQALELAGNPRIYARGDGLLVEMHEGFELKEVTKADSLKALLHDHFRPVVEKEDKNGPYTVPSVFSNNHTALLTRKTSDFPPIKAVSDIPLMLPDGSILLEPGYHKEHGYYLNTAGVEVQLMPLEEARALFLEAFNEFSYQAPRAGFTATLAFVLQPFLMSVIDDLTPLYAVLGSRRAGSGTGKGYLLDCVYRIHRGRPYTHDGSMPPTNEECGKVLFSALSEGVSHIIFDDIDHLKHRELMAAITSRTYKGRILGVSQRHEVSTQVTWAVSGNAPDIHRDFYRRLIPIYLGIGKARAWERPYSRPDLNRHILQNRNLYLSAALSILEHWREVGMPLSTNVVRGFDRWSAVMGGVLESAGFPHLLEARDGLDELIEVDNSDLDLLIDAWQGCSLADKKLKCKDLLSLARERELLTELHDGRSEAAGAGELGKFLKPYINDVFGEHYLRREFDSDSKTWRYFLEAVPDTPKLLADVFNFSALETSPQHPRSTPVDPPSEHVTGVIRGSSGQVLRDDESDAPQNDGPKWSTEL